MLSFLFYYLQLVLLLPGTLLVCGFAVRLCAVAFGALTGTASGAVFDLTSVLGTPVHELGHAAMCPLFGHKITGMRLWSPRHVDGRYGYVEHSYNKNNPWARLGSIFIGVGPLFSGLAVVVFALWLCFPSLWSDYLLHSEALVAAGSLDASLWTGVWELLAALPGAFLADPLRSLLGIALILSVSLHVSLSRQDVREARRSLPLFFLLLMVFALLSYAARLDGRVLSFLWLADLRMLSLFALVLTFALLWVALALLWRFLRVFITWF